MDALKNMAPLRRNVLYLRTSSPKETILFHERTNERKYVRTDIRTDVPDNLSLSYIFLKHILHDYLENETIIYFRVYCFVAVLVIGLDYQQCI